MVETKRLALWDVPVGTYFTATIGERAQLCLRMASGDVLVLSDDSPHLLPPPLSGITVTIIQPPTFRPQADGIADRRRKPLIGDIVLWSRDPSHQRRALCARHDGAPSELFIDLATGESLPQLGLEGTVSSVWSKWEALDRQRNVICRFPPRRLIA
jgi:hypothetical protein